MVKPVVNEKPEAGTPTYLLVSIVCAIVVFALAEIQNSFTLGEAFAMRSVLTSYIALGLTLAFFWKRLEKSPFLKISAILYLFGLWVSLFVTTLAPILLDGESPLLKHTVLEQFGFSFVVFSGLSLMAGLIQNRKLDPGILFSGLGALGLVLTSGGSFFLKNQHDSEDQITSISRAGIKEGAFAAKVQAGESEGSDDEGEGESEGKEKEKEIAVQSVHHKVPGPEARGEGLGLAHGEKVASRGDDNAAHGESEGLGESEKEEDHEPSSHKAATPGHKSNAKKEGSSHDAAAQLDESGLKPATEHLPEHAAKAVGHKKNQKAVTDDRGEEEADHHEPAPAKAGFHADDREISREKGLIKEKIRPLPKTKTASLDQAFSPKPRAVLKDRSKGKTKDLDKSGGLDTSHRWAYAPGNDSPEHWGELADEYRACTKGQQQSPIDIPSSWPLLNDIKLEYKLTAVSIVDTGHGLQFNVGDQNYAIIGGKRYKLLQFHIHTPSEHWIDGRLSAMEIHFVHKDEKNNLAEISVMVEAGQEQKVFGELWRFVPQGVNQPASPRDKLFNIAALLPKKLSVYRYRGSLTTPPCSENVLWSVASETITFSPAQIESVKSRYKNNARPIQKRAASLR